MFGRGRVEKSSGRSGFTVSLLTASATFGLFLLVALIAVWAVYYAPGPSARQGQTTVVTLPSGSGVSAIAARMFGARELLVAARHLTELDGIDILKTVKRDNPVEVEKAMNSRPSLDSESKSMISR